MLQLNVNGLPGGSSHMSIGCAQHVQTRVFFLVFFVRKRGGFMKLNCLIDDYLILFLVHYFTVFKIFSCSSYIDDEACCD
ncbi:hypothetical protein AQUCO_00900050v1 [Aquilegia coerulea]|uniref:Uncharacterized protein n=1 Tax=Aquilegia coerulea TaxID=218851 RepID=A0A2G5EBV9_AQUCA|nr:hypothetical protein AQUCO_00900050v1 [Aquilegia coerulea]